MAAARQETAPLRRATAPVPSAYDLTSAARPLLNPQSLRVLRLYARLTDQKYRDGVITLLEDIVPALDA